MANDPAFVPEHTRIVVADGRPVACTTLLPRRILGPRGWVDGAEITLVACHPDYRRRGFAGSTVVDALDYMAAHGMALGVFYGEPGFYPRFGCAPVLPTLRTELEVEVGAASPAPGALSGEPRAEERLEPAVEADTAVLLSLYERNTAIYPCSVARTAEPWLWKARNPNTGAVLVLGDRQGYAYAGYQRQQKRLLVREAGAGDVPSARRLLASLKAQARREDLTTLQLNLPPSHLLVRLALLEQAKQHYWPAEAGFAVVTHWEPLLPEGYRVDATVLYCEGRPVLAAGRHLLTQLVIGYRTIDDVLLALECGIPTYPGCGPLPAPDATRPSPSVLKRLRTDFPQRYPKYSEAPFVFWL